VKGSLSENMKADFIYSFVKSMVDGLVDIAVENAQNDGIDSIGLTGGVSYNIPIVEMVNDRVKKSGLSFLVHNRLPNGDGGISIGQNVIVGNKLLS